VNVPVNTLRIYTRSRLTLERGEGGRTKSTNLSKYPIIRHCLLIYIIIVLFIYNLLLIEEKDKKLIIIFFLRCILIIF
jgi:hypothetical protein